MGGGGGNETRTGAMVKASTPEVIAITDGSFENALVLTSTVSDWYHYRLLRESEIFLLTNLSKW